MTAEKQGPLMTDEILFRQELCLDYVGMDRVKAAVECNDYKTARMELAKFLRNQTVPEGFFDITYEPPENDVTIPGESESEACKRIQKHTLISVGIPLEYGETKDVDWTANPTSNGYKEWTWQLNRHHELKMLAHQYYLKGETLLAECAAKLLDSWLKQALRPEPDVICWDTKCWRTIECGIRTGTTWPYAYYAFYRNPAFTDDLLVDWLKSFVEHGERLEQNENRRGNWLIMEMNGMAHIAIMFPFLSKADKWKNMAFEYLTDELERQVYPDGFQFELTTNYHNVIVINYQRLLNLCKVTRQEIPERLKEKLDPVIGFEYKLMMPDGTIPDLNDGHRYDVKSLMAIRKEIAPENNIVRWLVDDDAKYSPEETSMVLPWSGFAVMRTGWKKEDSWALLDGGPFGRAHQHEDKLNVLFFANGKLLLTEGGNYAYDSSAMREYVLSTYSHNTALVDGLSQNRLCKYRWQDSMILQKAEEMHSHLGTTWDYAESTYQDGYGKDSAVQVVQIRSVYFKRSLPGMLIIVDRFSAASNHRYECLWHVDSNLKNSGEKRLMFEDVVLVYAQGSATVIKGQERPVWQGFVSTGTKQGMYRAVACADIALEGKDIRQVTVLVPNGGGMLEGVEASENIEDDSIILHWADGNKEMLSEKVMQKE